MTLPWTSVWQVNVVLDRDLNDRDNVSIVGKIVVSIGEVREQDRRSYI